MMRSSRRGTRAQPARRPGTADDELVILIMGPGDTGGGLPDPGSTGFALAPLWPDSLSIVEEDGALWFDGEVAALRGQPPPGARGHLRVVPRGATGWIASAFRGARPRKGGNLK